MLIGVVPDLALRRRTCYEPLVSTHPDTQGIAGIDADELHRMLDTSLHTDADVRPLRATDQET